ncbi:unnamed protein product [Soboliphyme baturini]|uniref:CPG4 domain-containing protein n=1 Tax=Soboliphyme baturini TaxID=241478 RepID=A0A183IBD3_9BILA|nr:unnamed protein product [Soboliphyme baturini]
MRHVSNQEGIARRARQNAKTSSIAEKLINVFLPQSVNWTQELDSFSPSDPSYMMLTVFSLFATLVLAGKAQADCTADFVTYHGCVHNVLKTVMPSPEEISERKTAIIQCFTQNGCQKPSLHLDSDVHPMVGGEQSKAAHVVHCLHEASKSLAGKVQECVASKIPGFDFSAYEKSESESLPPPSPGGDGPMMHLKDAVDNPSICPPENKQQVESCLKQGIESKKSYFEEKLATFCSGRKECFEKLSADCQNTFKETHKIVHDCMCHGGIRIDDFKPAYVQCMGDLNEEQVQSAHRLLERVHQRKCQETHNWTNMCQS